METELLVRWMLMMGMQTGLEKGEFTPFVEILVLPQVTGPASIH